MKATYKIIATIMLFSLLPKAKTQDLHAEPQTTSIFSNWEMYPESGDCGGQTLTLFRDRSMQVLRGYLQSYVGNCESDKTPITNIRFDHKNGRLYFSAATYVQDGKGGLEANGELRFAGTLWKNGVKGRLDYCPVGNGKCNSSETIYLPTIAQGTP